MTEICVASDMPCVLLELRPEIAQFAQIMEQKMREGEAKRGDWRGYKLSDLLERHDQERTELYAELARPAPDPEAIVRECADNANVMLMIAVLQGGMKEEEDDE